MSQIISGIVVHGDGYGRKIGYPTANLNTEEIPVGLREGVYAGVAKVTLSNTGCLTYRAGIVVGPKIDGKSKVEAHLIGFDGDLYDKEITLEIKKFLREYKNFDTEEELKTQIKKDLEEC
jgi:riboflavin kinase/FMN adenylyltransferase